MRTSFVFSFFFISALFLFLLNFHWWWQALITLNTHYVLVVISFCFFVLYLSVLFVYPRCLLIIYPPPSYIIHTCFIYLIISFWSTIGSCVVLISFVFSAFLTKWWDSLLFLFSFFSFTISNDFVIFNIHIIFLHVFSYHFSILFKIFSSYLTLLSYVLFLWLYWYIIVILVSDFTKFYFYFIK